MLTSSDQLKYIETIVGVTKLCTLLTGSGYNKVVAITCLTVYSLLQICVYWCISFHLFVPFRKHYGGDTGFSIFPPPPMRISEIWVSSFENLQKLTYTLLHIFLITLICLLWPYLSHFSVFDT